MGLAGCMYKLRPAKKKLYSKDEDLLNSLLDDISAFWII